MRALFFILFFSFSMSCFSQSSQLAYSYFRKGEYEKAAHIYKQLYEKNPVRRDYFKKLLSCYQLTSNFEKANQLIDTQTKKYPNLEYLNVEVGYNLQLQDQKDKAAPYYEKAIKSIEKKPSTGYLVGKAFQDNHLLDYALKAYEYAMQLNPKLNYLTYVATIYGEKGEVEKMFNAYFDLIDRDENFYRTIQRYAGRYVTDDSQDKNNIIFRNLLLKRLQENPKTSWNRLLSWLFIQQKDYSKALTQEKAIHKREKSKLDAILNLGDIAFYDKDYETTKNTFQYILENTDDQNLKLNAELYILRASVETAVAEDDLKAVEEKFKLLLNQFGTNGNTIDLQVAYSDFLTFKRNKPQEALTILEAAQDKTGSQFQKAQIKIKLADILVFTNQFNQALIKYTQVQNNLRNSTLAQNARFKVAQTSYFKGDFKWASTQLKVLKGSTSQLIANDAVDLFLLISDNLGYDSIPKALKKYAKADLLAYQNKNKQAIDTLSAILSEFKEHSIKDVALFKQADLYVKEQKIDEAEANYLKIVALEEPSVLLDNSYFKLAELYENQLNNIEKAKEMYQKIIFEHPSSIYLVDARKRFRKLRGDDI